MKKQYKERAARVPEIKRAMVSLKAALRNLDEKQSAEMWKHVRESFDYPVFMATPKSVGITATGETGANIPNDLPAILEAWKKFAPTISDGTVWPTR